MHPRTFRSKFLEEAYLFFLAFFFAILFSSKPLRMSRQLRWRSASSVFMYSDSVFACQEESERRVCENFLGSIVGLARGASLPEFFPIAAELATTEGKNRIGASHRPAHTRLLEPLPDDGLAARLDHA